MLDYTVQLTDKGDQYYVTYDQSQQGTTID